MIAQALLVIATFGHRMPIDDLYALCADLHNAAEQGAEIPWRDHPRAAAHQLAITLLVAGVKHADTGRGYGGVDRPVARG